MRNTVSAVAPEASHLPAAQILGMNTTMEELFGNPAYKRFVLQDHKRLPARFFARVTGAAICRLA